MHIFMHLKIHKYIKITKYLNKITKYISYVSKNAIEIFSILLLTNLYVQTSYCLIK